MGIVNGGHESRSAKATVGRTATEKILARVLGAPIAVGDIVYPEPELLTVHDWYADQVGQQMRHFGVDRFHDPARVAVFTDHEPVAVSPGAADRQKRVRGIVERFGVVHFFDVGRGGLGHVLGVENGLARPGLFVSGYDTHVTSYGAIGCLAVAVVSEVTELLACGSVWFEVPRTVRVRLVGELAPGVHVRDLAQHLIGAIPADAVDDAVVEFSGPALAHLDVDARLVLVNTPAEIGARSALVEVDEVTLAHCRARGIDASLAVRSDADAVVARTIEIDLATIEPMVAIPPRPELAGPVTDVLGIAFQHAFIGSCAGGMLADLRAAAAALDGRSIHPDVRLFVTPATQRIYRDALAEGLVDAFVGAGAVVTAPGCGPCAGGRIAPVADGETSLNTGTRNDAGRLGSRDARILLASPATVAVSCVHGVVTDPRLDAVSGAA